MNIDHSESPAGVAAALLLLLVPEVVPAQAGHVHRATRRRTAVVVSTVVRMRAARCRRRDSASAQQSTAAQQSATAQQQSATAAQQSATAQQQTAAAAAAKPPAAPRRPPGRWRWAPWRPALPSGCATISGQRRGVLALRQRLVPLGLPREHPRVCDDGAAAVTRREPATPGRQYGPPSDWGPLHGGEYIWAAVPSNPLRRRDHGFPTLPPARRVPAPRGAGSSMPLSAQTPATPADPGWPGSSTTRATASRSTSHRLNRGRTT